MTVEKRPYRIALGQISQESNSFVSKLMELDLFENSYLLEGPALFNLTSSDTEVAGFLSICRAAGAEIVPLFATRAVSGAALSAHCYRTLKDKLLTHLRDTGEVDGVLISLHGSMLAAGEDDPEGDLLESIRAIVGPDVKVMATLDLHANVTHRMVDQADALVSYTHYPHDDTFTTGERAARLLLQTLNGDVTPSMALAKVPILVTGANGQTFGDGPMAHITNRARELENDPSILSVSCFHVQPHLNVPNLGCGAIVITNGDPERAKSEAVGFAEEFWQRRESFLPEILSVAEAVERGRAIEGGPVLLVDAADCAGGGAAADSSSLLRELLDLGVTEPVYLMVVDPVAAETCAAAGIGAEISTLLGHAIDPIWGEPVMVSGQVLHLSDGRFRYRGGLFGGTDGVMGLSALLGIGSIKVLIQSLPTYDWADEQFRAVGLDPRDARFIGVKNPMNYRFAYREIAKAALIVDTPGPTSANIPGLPFDRITRPMFPIDRDMTEAIVDSWP